MKKLRILLTCASSAALLCASIAMIMQASNIYIYIFAPLGMVLSVLAYIIGQREIAAMRRGMMFSPITPSVTEEAWVEAMNQDARDIATYCNIPPQLLGAHQTFKMPEEWDDFVEELRKR